MFLFLYSREVRLLGSLAGWSCTSLCVNPLGKRSYIVLGNKGPAFSFVPIRDWVLNGVYSKTCIKKDPACFR